MNEKLKKDLRKSFDYLHLELETIVGRKLPKQWKLTIFRKDPKKEKIFASATLAQIISMVENEVSKNNGLPNFSLHKAVSRKGAVAIDVELKMGDPDFYRLTQWADF